MKVGGLIGTGAIERRTWVKFHEWNGERVLNEYMEKGEVQRQMSMQLVGLGGGGTDRFKVISIGWEDGIKGCNEKLKVNMS